MAHRPEFVELDITADFIRNLWINGLTVEEDSPLPRWRWVCKLQNNRIVGACYRFGDEEDGWTSEPIAIKVRQFELGGKLLFFSETFASYDAETVKVRNILGIDKMFWTIPDKLKLIEIDRRAIEHSSSALRVRASVFCIFNDNTIVEMPEKFRRFGQFAVPIPVQGVKAVVVKYYNNSASPSPRGTSVYYKDLQTLEKLCSVIKNLI